jgi:hypothetical protein
MDWFRLPLLFVLVGKRNELCQHLGSSKPGVDENPYVFTKGAWPEYIAIKTTRN